MDLNRILLVKQPPEGGIFQLRQRIRQRQQRRRFRHRLAFGLSFVGVLLALTGLWRQRPVSTGYAGILIEGRVALGFEDDVDGKARSIDPHAAMLRVSETQEVVVYRYIVLR